MPPSPEEKRTSKEQLQEAIKLESQKFQECYLWLTEHMPPSFFDEFDKDNLLLIAQSLMGFTLQECFSLIHLKHSAIVLCLDAPDADLRIFQKFRMYGIKNYRIFVSNAPPPHTGLKSCLRITTLAFTEFVIKEEPIPLSNEMQEEIFTFIKARTPEISKDEFNKLLREMGGRFIHSLQKERLILALDMFFRAKTRDPCQYEVRYNEDWKEKKETPSLQIVLAWRNVPKHDFLYHLAKTIYRHGLAIKKMNATYTNPYGQQNILIMSLGLHGIHGQAAWEEADIPD